MGSEGKVEVNPVVLGLILVAVVAVLGVPILCNPSSGLSGSVICRWIYPGNSAARLNPTEFRAYIRDPDVFVLDVYDENHSGISGTDAQIPFDRLRENTDELPEDKDTPLAVYCRLDPMSDEAVKTLDEMGYSNITKLAGGSTAWKRQGFPLVEGGGVGG